MDGTTNFLHGVPHFAISIGLEREGVLVAGVVYNVVRDELYWAERGQGAYLNDRRMRVAGRSELRDALFATGTPFNGRPGYELFVKEVERVIPKTAGIRRFGAASLDLAYVAAGRFDGYWERGLSPWDIAAGAVLRPRGWRLRDRDRRRRLYEDRGYRSVKRALAAALDPNASERLIHRIKS